MNWIPLEDETQLDEIISGSNANPQVIFKHSTRCSTSSMVKNRFDRNEASRSVNFYFLDLIKHRHISNKIAEIFGVPHESPQVLVIHGGKCIYHESHYSITLEDIETATMQV